MRCRRPPLTWRRHWPMRPLATPNWLAGVRVPPRPGKPTPIARPAPSRTRTRTEMAATGDGLVLIDKPPGWTSHDVVARVRRLAGTRKVGHAGTLDPMATGVLVLGVNRATRLLTYLVGADKEYTATIRLGQTTVTDDAEGEISASAGAAEVESDALEAALRGLRGALEQGPSAVRAVKAHRT